MKIKVYAWDKIEPCFPGLFRRVFGKERPPAEDRPSIVLVAYDEAKELIGFVSGYFQNADTFYMQRLGVVPELQNKGQAIELFPGIMPFFDEWGVRYLTVAIRQTDARAIITALKAGFLVNGVKVDTAGGVWVQAVMNIGQTGQIRQINNREKKNGQSL